MQRYFRIGGGGLLPKSCLTLETPWTGAWQVPLTMGFPRQEYWSGLPFPSPGDLPYPGIKPMSPALQADSLLLSHHGSPFSNIRKHIIFICNRQQYGHEGEGNLNNVQNVLD